jgi:hypothetical protein
VAARSGWVPSVHRPVRCGEGECARDARRVAAFVPRCYLELEAASRVVSCSGRRLASICHAARAWRGPRLKVQYDFALALLVP